MSNQHPEARPGDYDDVTRLRLQLHQAELQRDAFEKALRSDVMRIVKHAISMSMVAIDKHVADIVGCQLVERDDLRAENARLKAEVERLRASSFVTAVPVEEYEKLKAELERIYKLDPLHREAIASAVLATKEGRPKQEYVGYYPNPVNLVPIKPAGDDEKGGAS